MNKQGIKTKQKGVCAACTKPIVGQVITALGHTWHPEHFMCSHCNQELGTMNFFARDGKPYCEQDYHHLFSPRCGYCQGPILDKCISALDQTWHPEHFFCSDCGRQVEKAPTLWRIFILLCFSLVMKVFMRKMMQLSAKIATLSSLHPSVEVATHPSLKITFHL